MAKTKYGKYFITTYEPKEIHPWRPGIVRTDDTVVKGSFFYKFHWNLPNFPLHFSSPHIHKDAELLVFIGTNPDDPTDLGGEATLCMGPEIEKHVINKSTIVFIPPRFIHAPYSVTRVDRPWLFAQIIQGPVHTYKSFPNLLPKEERDKINLRFPDSGF